MYQELADMACERITAGIVSSLLGERPIKPRRLGRWAFAELIDVYTMEDLEGALKAQFQALVDRTVASPQGRARPV